LPHGVMVTHLLLVQTFQVRVLVGQLKYIISARQSLVEQEASLSKSLLF
jgi:hypothetical protein